ncbi:MAG: hypothetical protein JNL19_09655 [Burkholderiales bacterium]|nr:hypothetical protein [Burkholderiales bacterium]
MSHLQHLAAAHAFLAALATQHPNVPNEDKRKAVLALPALIRAHGLEPVLRVWAARGASPHAGPDKTMLASLAGHLRGVADAAAGASRTAIRTGVALDFLDAALHLLDGVIRKPQDAASPQPASPPVNAME